MSVILKAVAVAAALAAAQNSVDASLGASLQRASDRGKAMYLYDRAAWLTTDDLLRRTASTRLAEVGGWVVTASANGLHIDYFGQGRAADRVVYAADVVGEDVKNAILYPVSSEPPLKGPAMQMAHALRAGWAEMGLHANWEPCTNARFNTVVLPPDKDGTIPVYFLTPQTVMGSFPLGGHYEVDIGPDGRAVSTRSFTKSCITMSKPARNSGEPAALFITHLLDPHPTEIHVLQQYYAGVPVFVGTGPKSVWMVEDGRIEDVSAKMAK